MAEPGRRETRERLRSLIEEYETALEELKSSNEELRSANEKLHTANAELTGKVDALDRANAGLRNLFDSADLATVFLDRDLVIRSFTPAVTQVFNLLPGDLGRPITDLPSRFGMPGLGDDVRAVLASGQSLERRIDGREDGRHFLMRLAAYRDLGQRIEGAVLTFVDVTSLTQAEAHQRTLIAELNHRVKNVLMVVIGIVEQTSATAVSQAAFKDAFIGRLQAMARSYELLSRDNWKDAAVDELVRAELEPFGLERLECRGTNCRLKPKQALSLAMVLHELATNAAKYGALSVAKGRISVIWLTRPSEEGPRLEMTWRERDGPSVSAPTRRGFGMRLVEREAAYNLGGIASTDFAADGLSVKLDFPLADQP